MKKIASYIIILIIGLGLGWLYFGRHTSQDSEKFIQEKKNSNQKKEKAKTSLWTCSMHPEIRQHQPGNCPICGMDLIPLNHSDSEWEEEQDSKIKLSKNALALANIQTTKAAEISGETLDNEIKLSGQIQEDATSLFTQTAHIGGRLEKFSINDEGEYVKKGQYIGAIYSPEIVTAEQELLVASENKKTQPEIYNAVREKLKLWKLSNAEIDRVEHSKKLVHNFPLYADVSGIVKKRTAIIGNHVNAGTPLYSLINLSKVWVILDAYESDIHNFSIGQSVRVKTSAYPGELFKGKISFIPPTLNNQTRTIPIRVEIYNKEMKLKPGMLAFSEIKLSQNKITKKGVIIPKSAVLWTGKRSVVYVKPHPEKPIFEMREVTLGNTIRDQYIITNGLKENEEVVIKGAFTIDASAQLAGKNSLMN